MAVEKTIPEVREVKSISSIILNVQKIRTWKNEDQTDVTETSTETVALNQTDLTENTFAELEGKI
jgi:hypothetical protein